MMSRHFAQALRFALRTAGALRDTAPQSPTRLSNMSFLDDLKQQAKAREAQLRGDLAVIERHCAQVEEACQTVWRYLDDLGRQLEVLRPTAAARYMIDPRAVLEGLVFTDFVADLRKKRVRLGPLVERDLVEHIVLSARMVSNQKVQIAKDFPPEIERLEARLAQAGIRALGEAHRDAGTGRFIEQRYAFTADLTAGVRVLPLHEEGRLQFVIRNLDGLATIKASFAAQEVTIARLDELAKWWVGQPQHFLEGAQGVQRIEPV